MSVKSCSYYTSPVSATAPKSGGTSGKVTDQLDVVSGLLDDSDGVVDVPRCLAVDRHQLVVLTDAEASSLA